MTSGSHGTMPASRRPALDGLRGIAAIVVVIHHLLLTLPWFADRVGLGNLESRNHFRVSFHRIFEYSPLHILFGGTEAVVIFFVLSGYVLIIAVTEEKVVNYLRHRLVRLYVPIIAAVALAAGLVQIIQRSKSSLNSWWLNSHAIQFSTSSLFKNFWVIDGTDWMNSSLWSMRYEIIFSLLVVVFCGVVFVPSKVQFCFALLGVAAFVWIGMHFGLDFLSWLPVFFAGTALHLLPENHFWRAVERQF